MISIIDGHQVTLWRKLSTHDWEEMDRLFISVVSLDMMIRKSVHSIDNSMMIYF